MEQQAATKGDENEQLATLLHNARAVQAVATAVEGTLGPKGLDTLLVDEGGNVVVTNDGVTILEKMDVRHPAARMVVRIAQSQQAEMGDGTTTATVLAAALVTEGVRQVQR
ncbi:TCP-1/cpn60 chaperonin family protein, partial [Calditerricola satsumensis]